MSSPAPISARSLPLLPSITSLPRPPRSVSAPEPPARLSLPSPPSIVVGIVSVKTPLLSSMRTRSSPPRALTAILATNLRRTLKSAEPSSPTSIWRMSGRPAFSRRAIVSSRAGALDRQLAVPELRPREVALPVAVRVLGGLPRGGVGRPGRDAAGAGDDAGGGHCHHGQPRRPGRARGLERDSMLHGCVSPRAVEGERLSQAKDTDRARLFPASMLTPSSGRPRPPPSMERPLDPARIGDHLDRLYRAAWALCGSREDAEDLVQETYARVLGRPRLLRKDDDLGYLLRTLRNTFLTQRRTEGRRLRPGALPDQLDLVADPRAASLRPRWRPPSSTRRSRRSRATSATSSSPSTSRASRTRRRPAPCASPKGP